MFNDLEPAEIAALLSGLVFRAKMAGESTVPEKFIQVKSIKLQIFIHITDKNDLSH